MTNDRVTCVLSLIMFIARIQCIIDKFTQQNYMCTAFF